MVTFQMRDSPQNNCVYVLAGGGGGVEGFVCFNLAHTAPVEEILR